MNNEIDYYAITSTISDNVMKVNFILVLSLISLFLNINHAKNVLGTEKIIGLLSKLKSLKDSLFLLCSNNLRKLKFVLDQINKNPIMEFTKFRETILPNNPMYTVKQLLLLMKRTEKMANSRHRLVRITSRGLNLCICEEVNATLSILNDENLEYKFNLSELSYKLVKAIMNETLTLVSEVSKQVMNEAL